MHLMGIDMGTTSVKTAVFNEALEGKLTLTADYTLESKGDTVEFEAEKYWEIVKGEVEKVASSGGGNPKQSSASRYTDMDLLLTES